ncbi:MAG: chemotaxis protein CheD [Candidatus Eisenbacteria bacterium]|nr:chemotaxis protein CheD [Candidatus Eisenbacteria bacterium]
MIHTIGIGEAKVSTDTKDLLITHSLGSCIGLTLYDPAKNIGGMIHCMLPLSKMDPAKADARPHMFTDTGVADLLQAVLDLGADRRRLVAKVAGGSAMLDEKGFFKIGERNYAVLRKILWKNEVLITAEDVGGTVARTMSLNMSTGTTTIKSLGKEVAL